MTQPGFPLPLSEEIPWAPLYSVLSSELVESTHYGVVYAWAEDRSLYANAGKSLLRMGNVRHSFWMHSLLRPFQLMALYPVLRLAYPALDDSHYAVLLASPPYRSEQVALLREIASQAELPFSGALQTLGVDEGLQDGPEADKSGKVQPEGLHLAHLMYLKSQDLPLEDYLNPYQPLYAALRHLLGYLLNRADLPESVDSSGLPTFALNAIEMAQLYQALARPMPRDLLRQCPNELTDMLSGWNDIRKFTQAHPSLMAATGSLAARLMQPGFLQNSGHVFARQDAHGLLAVGIDSCPVAKDGLGFFIKWAHPVGLAEEDALLQHLLAQWGMAAPTAQDSLDVVRYEFHGMLQGEEFTSEISTHS